MWEVCLTVHFEPIFSALNEKLKWQLYPVSNANRHSSTKHTLYHPQASLQVRLVDDTTINSESKVLCKMEDKGVIAQELEAKLTDFQARADSMDGDLKIVLETIAKETKAVQEQLGVYQNLDFGSWNVPKVQEKAIPPMDIESYKAYKAHKHRFGED